MRSTTGEGMHLVQETKGADSSTMNTVTPDTEYDVGVVCLWSGLAQRDVRDDQRSRRARAPRCRARRARRT